MPLAQGIGAQPSETATDTSLKRSLAACTCSARALCARSAAKALPPASSDNKANFLAQKIGFNFFLLRFYEKMTHSFGRSEAMRRGGPHRWRPPMAHAKDASRAGDTGSAGERLCPGLHFCPRSA